METLLTKYRTALASLEELVVVTDGFGDVSRVASAPILTLNRRLLSILGIPPEEIDGWEGKPVGEFVGAYAGDGEALAEFWDRLMGDRSVNGLSLPFARGDLTLALSASGQVLPDRDGGYYLLCQFRDLTGMKTAEDRLKREREDRMEWDAFLRHELRGKLGPIIGFTELLILNQDQFTKEKIGEFLSSIMESAHRLNTILEVSREVQAYERGDVRVALTAGDVYDAVHGAIQEGRSALGKETADHPLLCRVEAHHPGEPLRFPHDPLKLQRVLRNLLINAWEHTREEAVIRVEDGPAEVRIRVRNGGPLIPADRLCRVFDRFNSTKSGRMGVGTTVARLLAEAQGGALRATSTPEEGTVFTIFLPKERGGV